MPVGVRLLERLDDRAHGQREVRARVAVGNRVDVEVVDALLIGLEVAEREAGDLAGAVEVHVERLTSSMRTSTAATESPVCRSTSYATRFRTVAATSARLRPYSTTTWRSISIPPFARLHLDAVGEPVAAREPREAATGHADDAVALGRDVADDLRDRLGGDGDPPEVGRAGEMGALVHAARLDDGGGAEGYVAVANPDDRLKPGRAPTLRWPW